MSYVIFCKGKAAKTPYLIEDLKLPVYSMEELCYYIYSNVSLCEEELLNRRLAEWIRTECGLDDLYASLDVILEKDPRAERIAAQIFAYTDYLSRQEREMVCERIRKSGMLGINERRKARADLFFLDGRYKDAIKDYEQLLEKRAFDDEKLHHSLLYNIGCCYGGMFYYDIAYGWFLQAAALAIARQEDIVAALFCKWMGSDKAEWECYLEKHKEFADFVPTMYRRMKETEQQWEGDPAAKNIALLLERSKNKDKAYYEQLAGCLEEWKSRI